MSKSMAIVVAIAVIWIGVLVTSLFAPEMVTGSQQDHFSVAAATGWFWGLLSTVFLLRSTVLRTPPFDSSVEHDVWVWTGGLVSAVWLMATILSTSIPPVVTGTDPTQIPVGAIVVPVVATVVTWFICELVGKGVELRSHSRVADPNSAPG